MAYINVDEVYILDNTGLQVDMATDIPFVDAGFTDAQKEQARKNIAAGGSNRNLLDNWYFVGGGSQLGDGVFPINQRGQASYSGYGNHFDRWRGETNYPSITLAADGVKFCSTTSGQWGTMVQALAKECVIAGKTVTASAIIDGTLASTTYSIPSSGGYDLTPATVGDIAFNLYSPNGTDIQFRFYTTTATAHTITAAKLEFGTVSTLANDAPPDFGEELRKCQRRLFIHDFANGEVIANGFAVSASYSVFSLTLPVSMASDGTLTGTITANPLIYGGGTGEQTSSFSVSAVKGNYATIGVATTVMPSNNAVTLYANTNIRLTISKEL